MRDLLKTFLLFLVFPLVVFIATVYRADGRTDPYYLRFTPPDKAA
jgi:hypothetical protein